MIMSMCKMICVTNRKLVKGDFLEQLERILGYGIDGVLLREKDLSALSYQKLAEQVRGLCDRYSTPLYLHTHIEAAKELGIERIHLPYHAFLDMAGEKNRFLEMGVSIHAVEEAIRAQKKGASYLIAGHIFATDCKRGLEPRGISFLEEVCHAVDIPVYAIGGITSENVELCKKAGAEGICLMSSLMRMDKKMEILENFRR